MAWFLRSMRFNGMSMVPDPQAEWPLPGGLAEQDAKLVEAFDLLRMQIRYVQSDKQQPDQRQHDTAEHER